MALPPNGDDDLTPPPPNNLEPRADENHLHIPHPPAGNPIARNRARERQFENQAQAPVNAQQDNNTDSEADSSDSDLSWGLGSMDLNNPRESVGDPALNDDLLLQVYFRGQAYLTERLEGLGINPHDLSQSQLNDLEKLIELQDEEDLVRHAIMEEEVFDREYHGDTEQLVANYINAINNHEAESEYIQGNIARNLPRGGADVSSSDDDDLDPSAGAVLSKDPKKAIYNFFDKDQSSHQGYLDAESPANQTRFHFSVKGLDTSAKLQVLSFEGLEAISSDYAVEVVLVCNHLRFDITQLLSKPAFLSFDSEQTTGIHGVVQHVRREAIGKDYAQFRVVLTSRLSSLKLRMNQKVFRKKSVPEIISEVLSEYGMAEGIDFKFTLKETYEKREYTTQYDQTDYDLIHHLTESEGIFYYFTHDKERHTLIFADANPFFKVRDEAITYKSDTGFVADERVARRFDIALNSITTQTAFRNYNFLNMKTPEGSAEGLASKKLNEASEVTLEAYDYPSRHWDENRAKQLAKIELERFRATQVLAEMDSDVIGLHAGLLVEVLEHPLKDVDNHWLIQEIRHAGKQPSVLEAMGDQHSANGAHKGSQLNKYFAFPINEVLEFPLEDFSQGYRNVTILSPKDTAYRPQKLHPKPKVLGAQTAIVTGPAGEEVYCDEYGRVKIQCHWDRLGNYDDNSSDWVRVRTGWAHNGYGAIAIPRVGMEVLVEYEEGDPDFPMIVGALHNGVNKVPYELPAHKTRSVFKTSSSKGGVGSNEFRIEDKAGQEQIFVQAQKDYDQLTKNNHTVQVNNNSHLQVNNEHSETIKGNRYQHQVSEEHHLTDQNRMTQIMMNDYKTVGISEHETIGTIKTTQAGMEIHLRSGLQTVIDGGLSLTLKAGGQHIVLNPMGIWMTMPVWTGGIPMEGTPAMPMPPLAKANGVNATTAPTVVLNTKPASVTPNFQAASLQGALTIPQCGKQANGPCTRGEACPCKKASNA